MFMRRTVKYSCGHQGVSHVTSLAMAGAHNTGTPCRECLLAAKNHCISLVLSGVGPGRVAAELDYRDNAGGGSRWDDLLSEYDTHMLEIIEEYWMKGAGDHGHR